jgi:hypothetical protein
VASRDVFTWCFEQGSGEGSWNGALYSGIFRYAQDDSFGNDDDRLIGGDRLSDDGKRFDDEGNALVRQEVLATITD